MKYALIARHRGEYPVTLMCRVLSVSRAGYYGWLARPLSEQARRRDGMREAVRHHYFRFKRRYGAPRLTRELNAEGLPCSENFVAKLMHSLQLRALNGKGFRYVPKVESQTQVQENVLAREFATGGPNRKWVTDITYIRLATGWAYLAIVLDLYSRRVVGWALASHMRESLVLEALTMALSRRRVSARLLLHSDRGVQYRGHEYHQRLRDLNIQPSMSRKGNCWDNAVMESFFSRLKVELIYPENYRTLEALRSGLFEYIEIFYNRQRRHSALGYISPEQFERSSNPTTVSTVCG